MTTANYFRSGVRLARAARRCDRAAGRFRLRGARAGAKATKAQRAPSATRVPAQTDGEYLARAGDCIACHTARGGEPFAGGLEMPTPFGTIYTPNITPDPETGIGKWSADDFWMALHDGKSRDGSLLYPAFPYPSYTKVTRADADAIYGYIWSMKPVRKRNTPHKMQFPYNQRNLLIGWRALYFEAGRVQAESRTRPPNGIAARISCRVSAIATPAIRAATCLAPRVKDKQFAGGLIPLQDWYAPSLTSNREAGLGQWEISEVVSLLRTGISNRGVVFGPMAQVVHDSLQYLTEADTQAMAVYLKSLAQGGAPDDPLQIRPTEGQSKAAFEAGGKIYDTHCKSCHGANGLGRPAHVSAARQQSGDQHGVLGQSDPHGAVRRIPAVDARQSATVRDAAVRLYA